MSHKDTILMDIQQHNDAHDMDFKKWMIWGITQVAIMTAMILDNVENMDHKAESEE
jgi:hypothetical protein